MSEKSANAQRNDRITPEQVGQIARITHEANRVLQMATGEEVAPHWENAPVWMCASAMDGVRNIVFGEVSSPEQSHQNWMKHKEADGWTHGPVKDADKKQHPCMVPYAELPSVQRMKDWVFFTIVNVLESALLDADYAAPPGAEMTLRVGFNKDGHPQVFRNATGPVNAKQFTQMLEASMASLIHWAAAVDESANTQGALVQHVVSAAMMTAAGELTPTEVPIGEEAGEQPKEDTGHDV
jgi:hypothetical protein